MCATAHDAAAAHAKTPMARHPSRAWLERVAPRVATTTASPHPTARAGGAERPEATTARASATAAPSHARGPRPRSVQTASAAMYATLARCGIRLRHGRVGEVMAVASGRARASLARPPADRWRIATACGLVAPWRRPAAGRARWRWASGSRRAARSFARAWPSPRSGPWARSPRPWPRAAPPPSPRSLPSRRWR